ncbi:MAG: hypothetical protein KJ852_02755 [Gammaproteobacteria bacterium]|jgi:hypothetical protein|nr:hypothetical protein [Gammaproteobacteria bacterium]MBU0787503.1 hypothetical protein [Gammaproteobacteria bacterium]MBU0815027.1 hypothetical protein [Gammaproteobacteria bacterium]MBU1785865.1 hypothetical protein [Gammaproteobacteria bacterium]
MSSEKPQRSSTIQIKDTPFAPHGQVDMWMDNNLLYYESTGPFNKELADCLAVAQSNFLQSQQPTGHWVSICTIKKSALATPDGLERYAELVRQAPPAFTPLATAYVIGPEIEGGQFMAPRFVRIFADAGRPFQIFETMAEARSWAEDMIAKARKP